MIERTEFPPMIDDEWHGRIVRDYNIQAGRIDRTEDPLDVQKLLRRQSHALRIAGLVRSKILDTVPMLDDDEVATEVNDIDITEMKHSGSLLTVRDHRRDLYPQFQFTKGHVRPVVSAVHAELRSAGQDWSTLSWWSSAHGALPRMASPIETITRPQLVIEAARITMR